MLHSLLDEFNTYIDLHFLKYMQVMLHREATCSEAYMISWLLHLFTNLFSKKLISEQLCSSFKVILRYICTNTLCKSRCQVMLTDLRP